jgi:predicted CopG family antitoxin
MKKVRESHISIKEEAVNALSKMPKSASVEDMMYRLYVIDKIKKGQNAYLQGKVLSQEELKKEIESW